MAGIISGSIGRAVAFCSLVLLCIRYTKCNTAQDPRASTATGSGVSSVQEMYSKNRAAGSDAAALQRIYGNGTAPGLHMDPTELAASSAELAIPVPVPV